MVTKTIFRKISQMNDDLELNIKAIHDDHQDLIKISEKALIFIDQAIREVKEMILDHRFDNVAEEVYFFKHLKPRFISKFIFYTTILNLESQKPDTGNKIVKRYFEAEQEKLKLLYSEHAEFYRYYRREATYLDHKIFVRHSYDLKMKLSLGFYNFDHSFTTSHDHLLARFVAAQKIDEYLKAQIEGLKPDIRINMPSPVSWSASKVGLTELVYALYHMQCFNGGNTELSEVIRFVEQSLNTDLGNFHKTIFEIRNRKQGPTKFLSLIIDNLERQFLNFEDE